MSAKTTIIVPAWNTAEYLPAALDSLRAQTITSWRAILVNDASSDATPQIFEAAAAEDPRFQVLHLTNRSGLGAARNAAIDLVQTEYLAFLDADDELVPNAIELWERSLDASGSDFVAGAYVRLRAAADGVYYPGEVQPWVRAATSPARVGVRISEHPEATSNIVAWSKLSRSDFWRNKQLRFLSDALYEDQVLAQQMYALAHKFDVIDDVVVHWRVRADASSITQSEHQFEVLTQCLDAMESGLQVLTSRPELSDVARVRAKQILTMDVPRLAMLGAQHPQEKYRRALGEFTRKVAAVHGLVSERGGSDVSLNDEQARLVYAVSLW